MVHSSCFTAPLCPKTAYDNYDSDSGNRGHVYIHLCELVVNAAGLLQRAQLSNDDVERQRLRACLRADVVAVAHVHRTVVQLLLADDWSTRLNVSNYV